MNSCRLRILGGLNTLVVATKALDAAVAPAFLARAGSSDGSVQAKVRSHFRDFSEDRFRMRTPGPPVFSSMNSIAASSEHRLIGRVLRLNQTANGEQQWWHPVAKEARQHRG
jgi:hypothetical protein